MNGPRISAHRLTQFIQYTRDEQPEVAGGGAAAICGRDHPLLIRNTPVDYCAGLAVLRKSICQTPEVAVRV